jgi:hypothetical protein
VVALGGRFGYTDQAETPNTQLALFEFEGTAPLLFEVRGLPTEPYLGSGTGNILHLEAGTIVNGATFIPKGKTEGEPLPRVERPNRSGGGDHFANFLAAVRSRKPADLNAEIEDAHYSSALCHLANLSYRVGEPVPFTSSKEFPCALMEAFDRMEHHLADANKLKLDALAFRLGPTLTFDPKTERFPNHAEANALLTREYRKPFTLTV